MIQFDIPQETIKLQKFSEIPKKTSFDFEGDRVNTIDSLTGMPKALPVYRLLNQNTGGNLYTISEVQRNLVQELNNFSFKEIAFLAYSIEVEGSIPIYRFQDSYSGAYFDTFFIMAIDNPAKFQFKGIAYYGLPI